MINPWLIYLMSCSNGILLIATIALAVSIIYILCALDTDGRITKYGVILLIISILILLLAPSERTMLAIIAANSITPDNLPTDMYTYLVNLVETCGKVVQNAR